ncbi:type II toxin-antitoxin system CcdA family antitoxin [uncultured Maricaulis sp.]|uniref:type II toxin-antitoxin system CcdA family antitoxin n=1 Tax=uncultured Maricaulis sp. TaxID=174710 RepID=UPI0030D92EC8|tara:strand:+ start:83947 stop:84150 length:204 start_codon:yes stop_codon:yes gene_type:complete
MKFETPAHRKRRDPAIREDVTSQADALKAEKSRRWLDDNADAIRAHNDRIEREGMSLPTPWWAQEEA